MIAPKKGVPPGTIYIPQGPIHDCSIVVTELDAENLSIGVLRFHCAYQFNSIGEFHAYLLRPENYCAAIHLGYRPHKKMRHIKESDGYLIGRLSLVFSDRFHTLQYEFHEVDDLLAYLVDLPILAAAIHYYPKMPGAWGNDFIWYGKDQFDKPYKDL